MPKDVPQWKKDLIARKKAGPPKLIISQDYWKCECSDVIYVNER